MFQFKTNKFYIQNCVIKTPAFYPIFYTFQKMSQEAICSSSHEI